MDSARRLKVARLADRAGGDRRDVARRAAHLACAAALLAASGIARAQTAPPAFDAATWRTIAAAAHAAVARESPAASLPFAAANAGAGRTLVIAHYFPVFPLAFDRQPAAQDYYATQYLCPEGEGGKFRRQGGFLRERPLPPPVYPQTVPQEQVYATNLAIEIARAERIGIDAFGVDLLALGNHVSWSTALTLLDAAGHVSRHFHVLPEPDMVALQGVTVDALADALGAFARQPAAYRVADGRLLVMPFAAEAQPPAFWRALIATMAARGTPIALVPDFVDSAAARAMAPLSYAASSWGTRDATAGGSAAAEAAQVRAAGIARWFMPVAPQDYRPKDLGYFEAANGASFRGQWLAAIQGGFPAVHLITWNDYSETSEIAPSSFTQYVFYDLSAYYIAWAKRGAPPPVTRDAIYYLQRRQILAPDDPARGPPLARRGGTPLSNDVEMIALLARPARIAIGIGARGVSRDVGAGLQTIRIAAAPGRPWMKVIRGGRTVLATTSDWPIAATPARHDATYGGGSSTRAVVRIAGPAACLAG